MKDDIRRHFVVSDSLQHGPERATIVAMYKRLVVGCAILSSPVETYITYLTVRAGWENAQIATCVHFSMISKLLIRSRAVLCYFTSLIAIQTRTSLYTFPRTIPRWYVYCRSIMIKVLDRDPKATLQSLWFQGGRIHSRLLRRLS
jgi:hypothetical protein